MIWNSLNTGDNEAMMAETVTVQGHAGKAVRAYLSRPLGDGPYPGLVLIPHLPGWDEWCRETARRFTQHGYAVVCPNIYQDKGDGRPDDIGKQVMSGDMVNDADVMEDTQGSIDYLRSLPRSNGRVGVIGMCSGGRHTYMAACTLDGIDAAVDCWGGDVIVDEAQLTPERPHAPIEYTGQLSCPLLGIFGNDDKNPDREQVDRIEEALKDAGKDYTFYRYDGAGHGIWYYDKPMYRQQQAMDSFEKCMEFLDKHLKQGDTMT